MAEFDNLSLEKDRLIGIGCLIIATVATAAYILSLKPIVSKYGAFTVNGVVLFFSSVAAGLECLYYVSDPYLWMPDTASLLALGYAIILQTVIGFSLLIFACKYVEGSLVAASSSLQPIPSSLFGFIFLHEAMGWRIIVGGILIVIGLGIVCYSQLKNNKPKEVDVEVQSLLTSKV